MAVSAGDGGVVEIRDGVMEAVEEKELSRCSDTKNRGVTYCSPISPGRKTS